MTEPPEPRTERRWRWLAVGAVLLPAVAGLAFLLWPSDAARIGPLRGLLLGQGPAQARARLDTGGTPGRFRSEAMGEDFALAWEPSGPVGDLRAARLEFHLGQLVAARLTVSAGAPEAEGPRLSVTDGSVLVREPRDGAVALTWLARSCPTHAREVASHLGER